MQLYGTTACIPSVVFLGLTTTGNFFSIVVWGKHCAQHGEEDMYNLMYHQ